VRYRRPIEYVPPYNYCDRLCDRCRIDKSRCLLWQTEMDDRLHREIDGKGEPTLEETVERMVADARQAIRMVEEQAREMGVDLAEPREARAAGPGRSGELDPIVEEARALTRGVAAFLRQHGSEHPAEAALLRHHFMLLAPKLGRAAGAAGDEAEQADAILQAQVAHRALGEMAAAFESIRRRAPGLGDAMLDLLTFMKALRSGIERRWLEQPCPLLEPVEGDAWWGPLRDITPTLKHFRRG
jgi:hypothetical protein